MFKFYKSRVCLCKMLLKCLLLLFIVTEIDAHEISKRRVIPCPYTRLSHGRVRYRSKMNLMKYMCDYSYTLVGHKYAMCQGGHWDLPPPVCVKKGCTVVPVANSVLISKHEDAWLEYFCQPGYAIVGSRALYCDGRSWNGTFPSCVKDSVPAALSCDFEDPNICGWVQDELHDFDWTRENLKTPSSFLLTGPSYDHTFGKGGTGYYMYIESTSKKENDTARLISPVYDKDLATNGCFSFYYHMYGRSTGGLRVYQKPDNLTLDAILQLPTAEKQKHILFERWGNIGDAWFNGISTLIDFKDNFQIVIEGIRGNSYTSDIAVDDVAILQGENCTEAQKNAVTPPQSLESCTGRCNLFTKPDVEVGCGCYLSCGYDSKCCPDFIDLCINVADTTDNESDIDQPQTQKLVASVTANTAIPLTSTTTTLSPIKKAQDQTRTTSIVTSPVNKLITTTERSRRNQTIVIVSTERSTSATKSKIIIFKVTTPIYNGKGILKDNRTSAKSRLDKVMTTSTKRAPVQPTVVTSAKYIDKIKPKKERVIEARKEPIVNAHKFSKEVAAKTSVVKASLITIAAVLCCGAALWVAVYARGANGRAAIARWRGRAVRDPEVRYLHSDVDDE